MAPRKKKTPTPVDTDEQELRARIRDKLLDHAAEIAIRNKDLKQGLGRFRMGLSTFLSVDPEGTDADE